MRILEVNTFHVSHAPFPRMPHSGNDEGPHPGDDEGPARGIPTMDATASWQVRWSMVGIPLAGILGTKKEGRSSW